ncbi:DUF4433 domain-containing protein [Nocardia sp. NBC_00881]|uniref:hypothetical protein n=1 Tax=Nocardia sp. NBC_00881 TaxID=2975995 RepID=UPI0038703790|nr:DUF4433 domain-containing protein [Nocardia sp. NBC_00881]
MTFDGGQWLIRVHTSGDTLRAERLTHELLGELDVILFIATRSDEVATEVRQMLGSETPTPKLDVRPGWYF